MNFRVANTLFMRHTALVFLTVLTRLKTAPLQKTISKFNMTATQAHLFPRLCARTFCAKLRDIRLTITAKIRRHNSVLFSYFYLIYFQKVRKSYLLKTMLKVLKVLQIQEFLTVSTRFSTRGKHHILSKRVISTVNISYFNFFQSRKQ